MKKLLTVIILLLFCSFIFANYSSLTKKERILIKKALVQAGYYSSLRAGKDKLKITKIENTLREKITSTLERRVYVIYADLIIQDKVFKRKITIWLDLKTSVSAWNWWSFAFIGGAFFTGFLLGNSK